jgi:NAD(P)-dependent dehydrogenase (short-subunit alcohol dehydrogenase family)
MAEVEAAALLAGRAAIVAVSGLTVGSELARGLEAAGARVALIEDGQTGGFTSRGAVEAAFAAAAARIGPSDLVVHAAATPGLRRPGKIAAMEEADFHCGDKALRATLYVFQAAHAQMASCGGAIVVLGPAMSLVGAREFVPLVTASEGQRSLVKTAARQWGRLGITVNWVAVANERYAPELEGKGPEVPELGPPPCALGRRPELAGGIACVLAFLGSGSGRSITGASINLDGGDWMTP